MASKSNSAVVRNHPKSGIWTSWSWHYTQAHTHLKNMTPCTVQILFHNHCVAFGMSCGCNFGFQMPKQVMPDHVWWAKGTSHQKSIWRWRQIYTAQQREGDKSQFGNEHQEREKKTTTVVVQAVKTVRQQTEKRSQQAASVRTFAGERWVERSFCFSVWSLLNHSCACANTVCQSSPECTGRQPANYGVLTSQEESRDIARTSPLVRVATCRVAVYRRVDRRDILQRTCEPTKRAYNQ